MILTICSNIDRNRKSRRDDKNKELCEELEIATKDLNGLYMATKKIYTKYMFIKVLEYAPHFMLESTLKMISPFFLLAVF
jgi:hypothetical protein